MTTSKRQAVVLGVLLVLGAAPPARAGDPTAAAFRKLAKSEVAALKASAMAAVKTLKAELKSISSEYADGSLTAELALESLLPQVSATRNDLEQGAFEAFVTLSAAGHQLLLDAGLPAPGPDFLAGGRGAWDDALDDVEAALDKTDDQLRATFAKFVKDMGKGAKAQGAAIDIRAKLPPHGSGFWSVVPPAGNPETSLADAGPDEPAPQILIEVRMLETNLSQLVGLGIRSSAPSVDVNVASTSVDGHTATTEAPDPDGMVTTFFPPSSLANAGGFITVQLDDGTHTSPVTALSAPQIAPSNPDTEPFLLAFRQDVKATKKEFAHDAADALKALLKILPQHIKAVAKGLATPELALRTGFGNLRDAREGMGLAWKGFAQAATTSSTALQATSFSDVDLPGDFQPDVASDYGQAVAVVSTQLQKREAAAARAYDKFVPKILKLAAKHGDPVGATWVVGRVQPFEAPHVTTTPAPPPEPFVAPHITDAINLVLKPVVTEDFSVILMVQADPADTALVGATATTVPDGDTSDLGELTMREGGTQKDEIPLLADVPILGWLFKSMNAAGQESLVVLMKPKLVTDEP